MQRTKIREILNSDKSDYKVNVRGWVRSFRNNQFIALNDGSCIGNLQVVIGLDTDEQIVKRITNGASISVDGMLVASQGKGQKVEVKADTITILGDCDPEQFPLQLKNRPSLEYLREIAHLRFRTNTFGAIFRVRHTLAYAIHKFFNDRGFVYLHTPIVTASDAEGAGEMFKVTTIDLEHPPLKSQRLDTLCKEYYEKITKIPVVKNSVLRINELLAALSLDVDFQELIFSRPSHINRIVKEIDFESATVKQLNEIIENIYTHIKADIWNSADPHSIKHQITELRKELGLKPNKQFDFAHDSAQCDFLKLCFYNINIVEDCLKVSKETKIDFDEDFFGRATNLTVSGQLEAELGAMAFSEVYTFGPTFRAENSNTARHLAEFWMIEPEVAFNDINDNMDLAEDLLKYVIDYSMQHNREDLDFLAQRLADEEKQKPQNERSELGLIEKLEFVRSNKFERITYTEAINILLESPAYKKKKFQYDVKWGIDMQSEHERYLVEKHFKKPVIVTGYPKEIKAFYMRQNDDGKTVAAMDILAPGIGEIVGGSQREERLDKLTQRMQEMDIPVKEMYWYLDTRRFGAVPHAGFGLGFERMVLFVTGMTNIRDVIPFPRTPKNAEF